MPYVPQASRSLKGLLDRTSEEEALFAGLEELRAEAEGKDPKAFAVFQRYTDSEVLFSQVKFGMSRERRVRANRLLLFTYVVRHGHGATGLLLQLRVLSRRVRLPLLLGGGAQGLGLRVEGRRILPGDQRQVRVIKLISLCLLAATY